MTVDWGDRDAGDRDDISRADRSLDPFPDHYPDHYVGVNGVNIRYWTSGTAGSVVILLHGGVGSVEFWAYNLAALTQQHRVYAFDMVGAGRSDKPAGSYSLVDQAACIAGFMDALGIARATLVGHSMGGGAALQLAITQPQRVERLVLVASFGLGREIARPIRWLSLPGVIRALSPSRRLLHRIVKQNVYDIRQIPPEWIERRYAIFAQSDNPSVLARLARTHINLLGVRASIFQPILRHLPQITAPTLVVWGQQDRVLPVAHGAIAAQTLPNARLCLFDRCGHYVPLEQPEQFNRIVLEFLAT